MADALRFALGIIVALTAPALAFIVIRSAMRMFSGTDRPDSSSEANVLRAEIDELRDLPSRMAEVEERLDFAERMLAQQREAERLGGGENAAR